jgi:hypothetical protein
MNHAELSRALALALGYYPESVRLGPDRCIVFREGYWRVFDYRSPDVTMPLLKRLMVEHGAIFERQSGQYWAQVGNVAPVAYIDADTLEEAIARAVIAVRVKP